MNFTFENQGTNTYLVYAIGEEDVVDTMSLGMLTNNRIPGLAATLFTQMDETKYIKYNVSSKISVKQFFMGPVNRKRLISVFNGIVEAMLASEEYMIDVNTILLDLEYIFTDVSTCETILICLPTQNANMGQNDLSSFFKSIMFSTQFDQTENCDYVAKIINYLNSTPVLSLVDFKGLLDNLNKVQGVTQSSQSVTAPMQQPRQPQSQQPQPQVTNVVSQQPQVTNVISQQPQNMGQVYVSNSVPQTNKQVVPNGIPQNVKPSGMNIPPATKMTQQPVQAIPTGQGTSAGKQMSMMNLLMHYNKENAQLYKEQKAAKKAAGAAAKSMPQPVMARQNMTLPNAGFAIPGQPTPTPGVVAAPAPKEVAQPAPQPAMVPKAVPVSTPEAMPQTQSANFGETTVLGGGSIGETTVLGVSSISVETKPFLIRTKNNEKIPLDKPVFRIGKEKSYVDYFIGDNSAISRSHANIVTRDGEYFVVDTNSTNHTYLNGTMLPSNVETKIVSGAKIRLANEDFEFKIQ